MVDNGAALSEGLANLVSEKAFKLEMQMVHPVTRRVLETFQGQAGLIRGERLTPSPQEPARKKQAVAETDGEERPTPSLLSSRFAATPITCIHNVVDEVDDNRDVTMKFERSILTAVAKDWKYEGIHFEKSNYECRPDEAVVLRPGDDDDDPVTWTYYDVTTARVIVNPTHELTLKSLSFEKVERADFVLQEGQKIGMAVYRDFAITAEAAGMPQNQITEKALIAVFGESHCVVIYTGEIIGVTADGKAFEHNINTFQGCSGAVIFLLDIEQDGVGVIENDYGKAIAIHVGGTKLSHGTVVNFAFKIP
ncbi:MAG: hypothetical protein SGILL_009903 [Bacillariaceae sp.]